MSKGRELYDAARAEIERRYHESLAALDHAWGLLSNIVPEFDKGPDEPKFFTAPPVEETKPKRVVQPVKKSRPRRPTRAKPRHFSDAIHRILAYSSHPLTGSAVLAKLQARVKNDNRPINITGLLMTYVGKGTVIAHREFKPMRFSLSESGRARVEKLRATEPPPRTRAKNGVTGAVARALLHRAPCTTKEAVVDVLAELGETSIPMDRASSRVSALFAQFRDRGWVESQVIDPKTREHLWSVTTIGITEMTAAYANDNDDNGDAE